MYVNIQSNHPPYIKKTIPQSVQSRLSTISSNETVFNEAKTPYENALHNAGYRVNLSYDPTTTDANVRNQQQKRKRNITWFNPPYSSNVKSNIGKRFLTLIDQHFPKHHPLHKICNRNTLKLSYSCMDNMAKITKAHNNKIINNDKSTYQDKCNCRIKEECPLPDKCNTKNVVYEATVLTANEEKTYIGLTSNTFKTRYASHKSSFNHPEKRHQTELSSHVWNLKDGNIPYQINWKILRHAQPYSPRTKRCNLCLWEKYHIITADKKSTLNSRTELLSNCMHRKKHLLSEYH